MGFFQLFHKSESFFLMNALQTGFFILLMTFVQFVAVRTIRNAETKWNLEQKNR